MATRSSTGNVTVDVVSEMEKDRPTGETGTPFRIALLGDFSGRGNRGVTETGNLAKRRVYRIDRDNFSEVLSQLQVELRIPILGKESPPVVLRFVDMDDFHPDHLLENVEVFDALKQIRQSLKDPATFATIANQLVPSNPSESSATTRKTEPAGNLLQHILENTEESSHKAASRPQSDLDDLLRQIVEPFRVLKPQPMAAELIANVDSAIGQLMRLILHHRDFQAIEAAWRGVHFLISQLETDEYLKLYLIDISKAELAADQSMADDISATGVYKLLVKQTAETGEKESWALLAGNFTFDRNPNDAALLSRLAKLSKTAGAPFVAAAHPHLLGCDSLAQTPDPDDWKSTADNQTIEAWASLRKLPEAAFIGLALPRFLLRLPYGKETEPIEHLDFEEIETAPRHEQYLWGNPSYVCVYLIAQAFSQYGWDFHPGVIQEINGLPLHVYKDQGESRVKACAEVVLTQRAAETILDHGLMPLLSFLHQDNVRLARFQSIANPPSPLLGKWR